MQSDARRRLIEKVLATPAAPAQESAPVPAPSGKEWRQRLIDRVLATPEPTLGEYVVGVGQELVGGAVRAVGGAVRGAGEMADAMRRAVPALGALDVGSGQSMLSSAGEAVEGMAPDTDPRVAASLPGRVASGLGQVGTLVGTAMVSPTAAAGSAFFGAVSDTEREISLAQSEADEGASVAALTLGGAVGILDMVPVGRVMRRLNVATGGVVGSAATRLDALKRAAADMPTAAGVAGQIVKTGATEAGTEAFQRMLTNAVVQHATDQEIDLLRGAADEAEVGGWVGTLLQTVVGGRRGGGGRCPRVRRSSRSRKRSTGCGTRRTRCSGASRIRRSSW